ncbi:MAG: C4-dicarboxylate ABC transporter [Bacteroidetes bacterium]|nr:C4-dicarboxylate ABC transporter [Bacteroidota bacterium]MCB0514341.1 C4-dicarboxylate ABC transporter [Bacteroidota bacterium]
MKKYLQPAILLRLIISIAYVALGGLLLFFPFSFDFLTPTTKIALALLVILYGFFRMYRAIKMANMSDEI